MKKTTRTLPLVLSVLLLLVFVTASPRVRSNPNPAQPVTGQISGQIRWKKDMGLIPISPGNNQASTSACSAFFIYGATLSVGDPEGSKIVAYSPGSTSQPKEQGEYYVCNYSMQVPVDAGVFVLPGMGDVGLLPKMSRQSYYWTDQWIGGTNSRPPVGMKRGFIKVIAYRQPGSKPIFFRFEMIYVNGDNPNPTLDSSTPLSEEGPSPILSRARSFAGAWQGKFGEGGFELILQQAGSQVTGRINLNSVIFDIKGGIADANNTLRFTIVRPGMVLPNGAKLPDEVLGTGELVMDSGGRSFKGKILNVDVTGTLVGR